jgi:sn-glycerol 3-phosphate transport system ATP-binding protein
MSHVILKGIEKTYPNGYKAIHGVDLEVDEGEFIVLVGPSGCGKSTLLRMVAGLETITSGEVHIAGRKVNELEPSQRDIAMVFQNYALYPHMTVYKNMAYGLKNLGTPKQEIEQRVNDAAKLLEIEDLLDRRPKQLSGGQRQRVAMGRAIVRKPTVFLFDEPLSNLDAKLRVQMRLMIKNLQTDLDTTTLYVTHDQVEAMTMADRLVVMNDGNAEQIGTPAELYEKPATQFVAGFIGSPAMNFVESHFASNGNEVSLQGINIAITKKIQHSEKELILGFRPEHIELSEQGPIKLVVDVIENLGVESIIHTHLEGTSISIVVRQTESLHAQKGQVINATIPPQNFHFFDKKTGKSLA